MRQFGISAFCLGRRDGNALAAMRFVATASTTRMEGKRGGRSPSASPSSAKIVQSLSERDFAEKSGKPKQNRKKKDSCLQPNACSSTAFVSNSIQPISLSPQFQSGGAIGSQQENDENAAALAAAAAMENICDAGSSSLSPQTVHEHCGAGTSMPRKVEPSVPSAFAFPSLASVLPVINPLLHKAVPRHSPGVRQLLSIGFEINSDNLLMPTVPLASMPIKKITSKRASQILRELQSDPEGDNLLKERCLSAKSAVAGTFLPTKLLCSHDPILDELEMTRDQHNLLSLAKKGYSLYIGGSAGTGKTVLLKAIYRELSRMGVKVAMTATTGVSSVHLGGNTFHSSFSVPMGDRGNWDTAALRVVDTIVVDEVSLLDRRLLEEFSRAAQIARISEAPFGGIQVILCGDFLQLSNEASDGSYEPCYMSHLFRHLIALQLVTPLRHKEGDRLLELLGRLRVGEYHPLLKSMATQPAEIGAGGGSGALPVYIFPKRKSVVTVNAMQLASLSTEQLVFAPQCGPLSLQGVFTQTLLCRIPRHDKHALVAALLDGLKAKHPASRPSEASIVVMPTRASEDVFCLRFRQPRNGVLYETIPSLPRPIWDEVVREVVKSFKGQVLDVFHDREPEELLPYSVSLTSAPLHSSESILHLKVGCRVMITRNLSKNVINGSIGTVEGFSPLDPSLLPNQDKGAPTATRSATSKFNQHGFEGLAAFARLPVVRLQSGELVQIPPIGVWVGAGHASYYYGQQLFSIPLQLGYAFTVHKVQGLTIDGPVVVNCDDYFHCPHLVYVACSRVRRLEQLTVTGVQKHQVVADPKSLAFAYSLPPATETPFITPEKYVGDWVCSVLNNHWCTSTQRGEGGKGGGGDAMDDAFASLLMMPSPFDFDDDVLDD